MTDRSSLTVFVVDDDASIRDSLALLLGLRGYRSATFASAEQFLEALQSDWKGVVLVDLRLPGMDGLQLQQELQRQQHWLPIVIITAHGDVAAARTAFKQHAIDFLEKPFDEEAAVSAIEAAFHREVERIDAQQSRQTRNEALLTLTPRESEVAELLVLGLHNRDVAVQLGISARTVEVHKARIMEKLGARGLVDLIRIFGSAHSNSKS